MRTTFAMAKASRIPEAINIRSTDSRFAAYLNECISRLLVRGKYWGTFGRYSISVDSQLLTLPAHIDTIEVINVARVPLPLRSQWFEFLSLGYGTRDGSLPNGSGINECLFRGTSPTFKSIGTASILTVKCDVSSDVGKQVRILGYDSSNNWVRTLIAGIWYDGELVTMVQGAGTATVTIFSRVTDIQAPTDMDGKWWLYEGTTAGTLIGTYEYWETNPAYKQYLIPFISTTVTTVEIMGKLAFIPAKNDTDYLIIGNLGALKLGCMACKAEEEHNWAEANLLWNGGKMADGTVRVGAIQELDAELSHHMGDGQELGINLVGTSSGFGTPVDVLM